MGKRGDIRYNETHRKEPPLGTKFNRAGDKYTRSLKYIDCQKENIFEKKYYHTFERGAPNVIIDP